MTTRSRFFALRLAAAALLCGSFGPALAVDTPEVEDNNVKVAATPVVDMTSGDGITGNSTGSSTVTPGAASADFFRINTVAAPLGIYRHRLDRVSGGANGGAIMGVAQAGAPSDTTIVQSHSGTAAPFFSQWYGFGKAESLYYRVTGVATSTADYRYELTTSAVTPVDLGGSFVAGAFTISTVTRTTTDTEMYLYDSAFNVVEFNDDELAPGTSLQSRLNPTLAAGTYYLAVSNFNTANDQQNVPGDATTGNRMDFPDSLVRSTTTTLADLDFGITDGVGNVTEVSASAGSNYEIYWATFTVIPPPPFGACCVGDGTCQILSGGDCATAGGVYFGDGSNCTGRDCTGSCCLPDDTCIVGGTDACDSVNGTFRGFGTTCSLPCGCFTEVEDNNSKAAANDVQPPMADGDCISGISTGAVSTPGNASIDYFKVNVATRPLGIYQHRLELTGDTPANLATIRGLTQTAGVPNPGTDAVCQTSSSATTPPRYVQWYGFGKGEMLYFRVTGLATTTAPYVYTLSSQAVTAQDLGTFNAGTITITTVGQGHSTDTDLWVYDENLNAIPDYGNDDESIAGGGTGATLQSLLTRTYAPGVYYLALSNFSFTNNQPAPLDDDFRTGALLDFPDIALNSSTTTNVNCTFSIIDGASSVQVPATRASQFDVLWFKFTVQVPPPFGACCFDNGSCIDGQSATDCANAGGTYRGDGSDCTPNPCPQPGACCLDPAPCQILSLAQCNNAGGQFLGAGSSCNICDCFEETEDNNNKSSANAIPPMSDADCITGTSTGSSTTIPGVASADYYLVTLAPRPLGVYRHRLVYQSNTPAHTGSIQGLTQTTGVPNPGTDTALQTASTATTPPRHVQWYGFGKGEMFYFRVTGVSTSTAPYIYELSTQTLTPTDIGNFAPGSITITTAGQGHSTDTDLWVYDAALNALVDFGNDDAVGLQSSLTRTYSDGRYYLALGDFNSCNNLGSPPDDNFRSGGVTDFPDLFLGADNDAAGLNVAFAITDASGTTAVPANYLEGGFEVRWFTFFVGNPCPGVRGDANCDGSVDFFDIDPFLLALFDPGTYVATFCGGSFCAADTDCSGGVDFFDIDPFLICLFSGCGPCP